MSERVKGAFFCILPLVLLCVSVNQASADEVDDLLNKCEIASNPKPSVMVYDYEFSPEMLMPGDVGVLTITLKNMQDKPLEREIDINVYSHGNVPHIDIDTKTRFTMDAYIKEAYVVERDFKVYNKYISTGVIGPNEKVDLAFKIKAPLEEGIYLLKFIADIKDTQGKSSKGIRYFIPVTVSDTVNMLPVEVSQKEVRLEVINEGLSDVESVYAVVSNATGVEVQQEKVYIGRIKPGESATAVFTVNKAGEKEGEESAVLNFKAVYKNGINKHESDLVCVRMPYSAEEEKEKEKGESLLEERSENSFKALTTPTTPIPTSSNSNLTPAVFAFAGLLVPGILYLFLSKRKREGKGGGKDMGGDEE
jgi:hypothetical protein